MAFLENMNFNNFFKLLALGSNPWPFFMWNASLENLTTHNTILCDTAWNTTTLFTITIALVLRSTEGSFSYMPWKKYNIQENKRKLLKSPLVWSSEGYTVTGISKFCPKIMRLFFHPILGKYDSRKVFFRMKWLKLVFW